MFKSKQHKIDVIRKMRDVSKLLKSNGISTFASFGSLLGIVRESTLLDHDYDADLMVDCADAETVINILLRNGYTGLSTLPKIVILYTEGFRIDIFMCERVKGEFRICYDPYYSCNHYHFSAAQYVNVEGFSIPIPLYPEDILEQWYGDWKTPSIYTYGNHTYEPTPRKKTKVLCDGVFDLLHPGHIELFKRAYTYYDEVCVAICSDKTAKSYKRLPFFNQQERRILIESIKYVDEVVEDCPLIITKDYMEKLGVTHVMHGRESYDSSYYDIPDLVHLYDEKYKHTTDYLQSITSGN